MKSENQKYMEELSKSTLISQHAEYSSNILQHILLQSTAINWA